MDTLILTPKDRFFDGAVTYFSSLASTTLIRDSIRQGLAKPFNPQEAFPFDCKLEKKCIRYYPFDTYEKIMNNDWPSEIRLTIQDKMISPSERKLNGFKSYYQVATQVMFINYYHSVEDEIKETIADVKAPAASVEILKFGRMIRNAFAHGNKVYITNNNVPPVKWRSLQYGPANNGQEILFKDIAPVEIVFLMKEMDEVLI